MSDPNSIEGVINENQNIIAFVHEEKKLNECEICKKTFSQKVNLKRHIDCVHNKVRNYKCEICNKAFSESRNLKKHIASIHEGINQTVNLENLVKDDK